MKDFALLAEVQVLATVDNHRSRLHNVVSERLSNGNATYLDIMTEGVKYLGSQRLHQEQRCTILNDAGIKFSDEYWNSNKLSRFARENGIRMMPIGESAYQKFLRIRREQQVMLPVILEQIRAGNLSYSAISKGLFARQTKTEPVDIPPEAIGRVLQFCRNDSPELARQITEAFEEGEQRKPDKSSISKYLHALRTELPAGAVKPEDLTPG